MLKRHRLLVPFLLASACGEPTVCDPGTLFCADCFDGVVTCTYDGTSATEASCDDCQALVGLYDALCQAGSDATLEEVQDGAVCEPADTGG